MSRLAVARAVAAVLAFAASVAFILVAPHWDKVGDIKGAQMGTYFIAIVGLNIVTGYTGQISLAQGAFMAVGGYTTAFLVTHGVRDLWTIPVAALVAGVFGFLLGIPALRLSGLYLALVTFGLAVAMPDLLAWDKLSSLTSGGQSDPALRQQAPARPGLQRRDRPRTHDVVQPRRLLPDVDARARPVRARLAAAARRARPGLPRGPGQ